MTNLPDETAAAPTPAPGVEPDVARWRRATREQLLSRRLALRSAERTQLGTALRTQIRTNFPELTGALVGFYHPIKGEPDLRPLLADLLAEGAEAALPVVVARAQPVQFHAWRPGMTMRRGAWNIPVPADARPVQPTALLVPLLGFDADGYRLGYGGGYYDRTLAAMSPRPFTIGVGFELGRLDTIRPQPHDIPMDALVTEIGAVRLRACDATRPATSRSRGRQPDAVLDRPLAGTCAAGDPSDVDPNETASYASPPCFMHELDPSYLGYLSTQETLLLLNRLLDDERAAAHAVAEAISQAPRGSARLMLMSMAAAEGRFRMMLVRHIHRLGGQADAHGDTGPEADPRGARPANGIERLNCVQARIVTRLREALTRIGDDALHRDLTDMRQVHEANIARCEAALAAGQGDA